jgi:large subunit ribosomal protein L28
VASVCEICGKGPGFGNSVSRLGKGALDRKVRKRTKRRFNPNVQRVRALIDGTPRRVNACTRCIKAGKVTKVPTTTAG